CILSDDMTQPATRIGFVGLGRMGSRIARNLAADGREVQVWNRTTSVASDWVAENGGAVSHSLSDMAATNEVLITMLADGEALTEVYESPGGLAEGIDARTLAIDMGTSGPGAFERVRALVEGRGATMVDAPVSGATAAAEAASLLVMVGGASEAYARVEPILRVVGNPVHVGPTGAAAVLKLAVNSVLYGLNQAVGEAVALAERAGVEPETTLDVLARGAAGAPMLTYRREQYLHPDRAPVSFTVDLARKDLALALDQAKKTGASSAQLERTLELMEDLIQRGFGSKDMGYVVEANRRVDG
ncbi:MAG: NAD(P)-dependent oxidoreductase, partial [Actinomycetota bacterium]|nr:NAD(P)-dependent oxidoreductase [Actinomycetota bacterium]